MSETMIERVAKAIWGESSINWEDIAETGALKKLVRQEARAAIEAMRSPTAEMVEAGLSVVSDITVRDPKVTAWDALRFHRAMISAALSTNSSSLPTPAATPTDSANPPPVESVGPNSEAQS